MCPQSPSSQPPPPQNKQGQAEIAEFKHHYRKLFGLFDIIWGHYLYFNKTHSFSDHVAQSHALPSMMCDHKFLVTGIKISITNTPTPISGSSVSFWRLMI